MSLKSHILEAWNNWKGKTTTQEDKDIVQLLHFIEDWDEEYNARLIDFINTDGLMTVQVSAHDNGATDNLAMRLLNSIPPLPKGSSFRVDHYNNKRQELLCPKATLTLSNTDTQCFYDAVGGDWEAWVEEFKLNTEAILDRKLAWTVNYRGEQ